MVGLEDSEGDNQAPGLFVLVSFSWKGKGCERAEPGIHDCEEPSENCKRGVRCDLTGVSVVSVLTRHPGRPASVRGRASGCD